MFQQPWLVDIDTNPELAQTTLGQLFEQLSECQKKATNFRENQKKFKVNMARQFFKCVFILQYRYCRYFTCDAGKREEEQNKENTVYSEVKSNDPYSQWVDYR